jgi:hypothetical protein
MAAMIEQILTDAPYFAIATYSQLGGTPPKPGSTPDGGNARGAGEQRTRMRNLLEII